MRQRADADLFEPDDIFRVVCLETDVAFFRAFGFALGFPPDFSRGQVRSCGIKAGDVLALILHIDLGTEQRDDHRLPASASVFHCT